jgi:hypothetical protein
VRVWWAGGRADMQWRVAWQGALSCATVGEGGCCYRGGSTHRGSWLGGTCQYGRHPSPAEGRQQQFFAACQFLDGSWRVLIFVKANHISKLLRFRPTSCPANPARPPRTATTTSTRGPPPACTTPPAAHPPSAGLSAVAILLPLRLPVPLPLPCRPPSPCKLLLPPWLLLLPLPPPRPLLP